MLKTGEHHTMPEALKFTQDEKETYRKAYAPAGATDAQWALFINECQRRALVPGKDVIFQLRSASEFDKDLGKKIFVKRVTFITTISGLRLIAERSGKYEGRGPFVFYYGTEDGDLQESKIPLGKRPHAVSVEGYRTGWRVPLFATARYDAYVQLFGEDKKPTAMWATRGEEQLAKCCEAQMLRTVAPEECAGLLIDEELGTDIDKKDDNQEVTVPAVVPLPISAPPVNQAAAVKETAQVCASPNVPSFVLIPAPDMAGLETLPVPCQVVPVPQPPDVPLPPEPEDVSPKVQELVTKTTVAPERTDQPRLQTTPFPPMSTTAIPAAQDTRSHSELFVKPDGAPVNALGNTPATRKEHDVFLGRAAKLVRDKLPAGGMKDADASNGVKNYLLKGSGKSGLKQLSAADWEKLLKVLEDAATPADAVAIVKACK